MPLASWIVLSGNIRNVNNSAFNIPIHYQLNIARPGLSCGYRTCPLVEGY